MDANKLEKYYNNTLFAFLPNICNSACDFCYVNPIIGKTAKLNKTIINNFEILVKQAKKNGFNSIRITGGEPLVFVNFNKLVSILKLNKLNYAIITNGQELSSQLKHLELFIPKKINVSFHSFENYENIFKNKIDLILFFKAIDKLSELGTIISITIVYQELNKNEIYKMIDVFEKKKIDEIKIIYPNIENIIELEKSFKKDAFKSSLIDIRYTDFEQKECLLKNRGFLSIIIENLQTYNCCTTVGEKDNQTIIEKEFNLSELIKIQYNNNMKITTFPCSSYIDCCPISLKNNKKSP